MASLTIQWLRFRATIVGRYIPQVMGNGKKKKKKKVFEKPSQALHLQESVLGRAQVNLQLGRPAKVCLFEQIE